MQISNVVPSLVRTGYSRIPELDGVRAIAIWMGMIMHVLVEYPHPHLNAILRVKWVTDGWALISSLSFRGS